MNNPARYWMMIAVLLAATAGMGFLSHGEATPPARALNEFPKDIGSYRDMDDLPFDQDTLKVLGVTDYLNRVYFSPQRGHDPLAQELPSRRRVAAHGVGDLSVAP